MTAITGNDVHGMARHWLQTPVEGYLGSSYGQDAKALLQRPEAAGLADEFLGKLREDVPVIGTLPSGATNLYGTRDGVDKLNIVLEIAGTAFEIA